MNYIDRKQCLITGLEDIEFLYKLKDFPVFIGCTDQENSQDIFADMVWGISKSSGVIQLMKLLPPEIIYSSYHSEAVGGIWKKHHELFSEFILKNSSNNIVEMGGSNGKLAELCVEHKPDISWLIVEPNLDPNYHPSKNIQLKADFIENHVLHFGRIETFVHSHVIEHLYNPMTTLRKVAENQEIGDKMIFSVPDLFKYLNNKFANAINFEHTYFLTENITNNVLESLGYKVKEQKYFNEHSIFYCAEKISRNIKPVHISDKYTEYKNMYLDMIDFYKAEANRIQLEISNNLGPVYIFGAHIFSQMLLYMGVDESLIKGVIDNSPEKQGKRLYGTNLNVLDPIVLKDKKDSMVIVKAGQYQKEIESQLQEINSDIQLLT